MHLNDNESMPKTGDPTYNKLYKVAPMINHLSENFLKFYKPTKEQAIDESMIRFKGRSSLKQYLPQKPIKRGFKVWVRADKYGFVCEFQIYTGKIDGSAEKLLGERVVRDLSRELTFKNYHLYFGNYFTSVSLMICLKNEGIQACGTVRSNRKELPKCQKPDKSLKKGDSEYRTSFKGISWVKWKDNKAVQFLSNFHDPSDIATVGRKQKDGSILQITAPKIAVDYNSYMGCVDKADMLKSTYELNRKSKKRWHRIFWHLVDVTVVNSFIIYRQNRPDSQMALKEFRLAVANDLIGYSTPNKRGKKQQQLPINNYKPKISTTMRFSQVPHLPTVLSTQRRCVCCSTKSIPCRTSFFCSTCNVPLCIKKEKNCFQKFHVK
ncbi:piggyBac transposable element-derived protein 4-like [Leptopilina boulardi]|uniref:piggyBac transposable element-derived protein 4-like n=1 Tax=Leptopilina boulardi TaxID=63433 RepID=UPI0021F578E1|nr:piggyBac transposable element-derived protein 4-like [Leptopilina boulardi]